MHQYFVHGAFPCNRTFDKGGSHSCIKSTLLPFVVRKVTFAFALMAAFVICNKLVYIMVSHCAVCLHLLVKGQHLGPVNSNKHHELS